MVYGIYLVEHEEGLFDEKPVCDNYGPLSLSTYKEHNQGNLDISIDFKDYNDVQDEIINDTIERVVEVFGKFKVSTLYDRSHRESGAWLKQEKNSKVRLRQRLMM
ncbi:hypothetical protein SAMN02745150_00996 [Brevinema andersonii]|uniref:Uncharacterized protein n=2 Tax=Brevinema andersonii TaxID=34097 RepID=A0A1I1E7Z8_BREAD|nr:hypothetical protein SAMN02745150_00996 [Brevinema andersonii]